MQFSSKQKLFAILVLTSGAMSAMGVPLTLTPGPVLSHAGNLIQNGSFEAGFSGTNVAPVWATGTALGPFEAITGWTSSGGPAAYASRGPTASNNGAPAQPDGNVGIYFGNGFLASISETPTFNLNGSVTFVSPTPTITSQLPPSVTLKQTVSGLSTGNTYALSFWASGEDAANGSFTHDGLFALDVTGFSTTWLAAPSGAPGGVGQQIVYRFEFVPTSSTTTFQFTNWGHISGSPSAGSATPGWNLTSNTTELVMDDVILNDLGHSDIVPEPASIGLLAVSALSLLARRSKRSPSC